ncbi:MAG TPA: alanine--tRNA ligase, partial [Epsilonproteobacteria bacterium]|nr:alanine--tRNA ligase [Campylobacterota bacterium]
MKREEEGFFSTIEAGITLLNKEMVNTVDIFSGEVAFKLYDTYGFPLDLTQDMLREKGIALDQAAFDARMNAQRAQSQAGWKGTGDAVATGDFKALKEMFGVNAFVGYDNTSTKAKVLALLDEDFKQTEAIDGKGWVLLDKTPFYAESGGQVGDRGTLNEAVKVLDTKKFLEMNLSQVEGSLKVGEYAEAVVDHSRREVEKHHSATHLLHAGLREILGDHIAQAGSRNDDKRLRVDFSHPEAMSREEISSVEEWVNDKIARGIAQETKVMGVDDAKASGAMALFGEKYGDKVRVVRFEDASVELCGGTHVSNTAEIGLFMVTKESVVSAGVRRIEAVCGRSAVAAVKGLREELAEIRSEVKNQNPIIGITKLKEQVKTLKGELQAALNSSKKTLAATEINGVTVIVDEVETGDIKTLIDEAKNSHPRLAMMLFQKKGDKVLIAAGSKESPVKAGEWIKTIAPILGGGGGGRPDFAQAGGRDTSKIGEAIEESKVYLSEILEGGN